MAEDLPFQQIKDLEKKLKNFPHLKKEDYDDENQNRVFSRKFPWGCSQLEHYSYDFDPNTDKCQFMYLQNFVNFCLAIKYGIIGVVQEKYMHLFKVFSQLERDQKLYLKIFVKNFCEMLLYGVAIIQKFEPERTFRFWKFTQNNKDVFGVIRVKLIAVGKAGQIDESLDFPRCQYNSLKNTIIPWGQFEVSQEYEWQKRREFINKMKQTRSLKFEQDTKTKTKDLMNKLQLVREEQNHRR